MAPQRNPVTDAGRQGQDHPEDPEGAQVDAGDGRRYRSDKELSLTADVEEPGAEGDGHGEAGEDQGRRVEQGTPDGERRPERSPQERSVGLHRIVPGRQHDDRPDDEGDEDGYEGEDESPGGVRKHRRNTGSRLSSGSRRSSLTRCPPRFSCPAMRRPSSSSVASGPTSPTILPSVDDDYAVGEGADLLEFE